MILSKTGASSNKLLSALAGYLPIRDKTRTNQTNTIAVTVKGMMVSSPVKKYLARFGRFCGESFDLLMAEGILR